VDADAYDGPPPKPLLRDGGQGNRR